MANQASAAVTVNIVLDTVAPTVAITAPANGSTINDSLVNITGTASDVYGINFVETSIDGQPYVHATGTTDWALSYSQVPSGQHTISARATDNNGNQSTPTSITITTNSPTPPPSINPTCTITYPIDNASGIGGNVTVTGLASDDVAVARVECQLDGGSWRLATGTTNWSFPVSVKGHGPHFVRARSIDTSGNYSPEVITHFRP